MKARPILFSGPMIRALLDGRKTQTRRIVKDAPVERNGFLCTKLITFTEEQYRRIAPKDLCPYGLPADLLWVRETFVVGYDYIDGEPPRIQDETTQRVWYRATHSDLCWDHRGEKEHDAPPWKPSIHMPRWASRLTMELTALRVERLQDISEADAIAEGIQPVFTGAGEQCGWLNYEHRGDGVGYCMNPVDSYASLWRHINGPDDWDENPFVWCLSFRVYKQNVGAFLKEREVS